VLAIKSIMKSISTKDESFISIPIEKYSEVAVLVVAYDSNLEECIPLNENHKYG
jgi:hypothetical protein